MLYSGEQFDTGLQQQYLRARYYDQGNGRFNRLDPFRGRHSDPQSFHKYAYTHGDPVNGIDPTGEALSVQQLNATRTRLELRNMSIVSRANLVRTNRFSAGGTSAGRFLRQLGRVGERQMWSVLRVFQSSWRRLPAKLGAGFSRRPDALLRLTKGNFPGWRLLVEGKWRLNWRSTQSYNRLFKQLADFTKYASTTGKTKIVVWSVRSPAGGTMVRLKARAAASGINLSKVEFIHGPGKFLDYLVFTLGL